MVCQADRSTTTLSKVSKLDLTRGNAVHEATKAEYASFVFAQRLQMEPSLARFHGRVSCGFIVHDVKQVTD